MAKSPSKQLEYTQIVESIIKLADMLPKFSDAVLDDKNKSILRPN